ncbi:hypothetical protein ACFRAM_28620 [Paenibacillus sp. NPDC056722]|uniref:hypothetical protein n=1 Tax=Paenibacillus sp. NPDC056722 TaxID=3345924 RepID=UPI0036BBD3D0
MTHDIATISAVHPAPLSGLRVSVPALDILTAHAAALEVALQIAQQMCSTALVPPRYSGRPLDGAAAILFGIELGLNPIQSLWLVDKHYGRPSIEARTMVALLKARGYKISTVELTDTTATVDGVAQDGSEESSTWTMDRAIKAEYVATWDEETDDWVRSKNTGEIIGNPLYHTDPQAMLYAKAASEVCRRLAPEVLLGMPYSREDLAYAPKLDLEPETAEPASVGDLLDAVPDAAVDVSDLTEPEPEPEPTVDEQPVADPAPVKRTRANKGQADAADGAE